MNEDSSVHQDIITVRVVWQLNDLRAQMRLSIWTFPAVVLGAPFLDGAYVGKNDDESDDSGTGRDQNDE